MKPKTAITPTREEDYSQWYQQVIKAADLAEHSAVRGCMVIKPWGYTLWENIQRILDVKFKETGHENAYFPIFIPLSYLQKEAQHVEGFAKECAVVTHHRLEKNSEGKLVPSGELEEPLIVRPTSEMIIGESFSRWIQSYRDLPLLINQWANVVRWEMRTRLFLRTAEFLWQEGHTAHATKEEAEVEARTMLDLYHDFAKEYLAIPVIKGEKTELERFPGAVSTYSIEAMMQDRKALQGGTSHFLGQNFSKSCDIRFQTENGEREYAWTTSWAVTTRLIGALVMIHSDDDGLILPPKIASSHIVILPVLHKEEMKEEILSYCKKLKKELGEIYYGDRKVQVILDERDLRGGEKTWSWIKKGVPIRLEVGPKEIESHSVFLARRDKHEKKSVTKAEFLSTVTHLLDDIQNNLYSRALKFRESHTKVITNKEDFFKFFTPKDEEKPEAHGGFALCHFCMDPQIEKELQEKLNVTIRCIPLDHDHQEGACFYTQKKSHKQVIFAKGY